MKIRQTNLLIAVVVIACTRQAIAQPADYIGIDSVQGTYFIDVPEGMINDFFSPDDFPNLVSAHRGGFKLMFPENAIETFNETIRFAPSLLETDLRRTSDGVWILMHDDTLDRTTTGSGVVADKTWDEIKDLRTHSKII